MRVVTGSFQKTASTGTVNQDITSAHEARLALGVGESYGLLILQANQRTATGFTDASHGRCAIGAFDGTRQWGTRHFYEDNVSGLNQTSFGRIAWNQVFDGDVASGTDIGEAVASFLADGFRLAWTNSSSAQIYFQYTVLIIEDGDAVNFRVDQFVINSGTGDRSYSGAGFTPKGYLIAAANDNGSLVTGENSGSVGISFGGSDGNNEFVVSAHMDNGTNATRRSYRDDRVWQTNDTFDVAIVHDTLFEAKNAFTASSTAADQNPWPEGYSGWFTVSNGFQNASASVSGLPSVSASGIAVRGRHAA